ncbi:MAG: FIST C-terminal domain-containing protein [Rhodospirillales bacterium]|nr:FIST C-terminal domain-containing protein [Rhodospirillales bacterium]
MSKLETIAIRKGASAMLNPRKAVQELWDAIYADDAKIGFFFCSPEFDLVALEAALAERFGDFPLVGCTTAGELTPFGYRDGSLVGLSLCGDDFEASTTCIEDIENLNIGETSQYAKEGLERLKSCECADKLSNRFAFLLIDGLCQKEDAVVSGLNNGLEGIPLFGGSAGDDLLFEETFVFFEGKFRSNAAVLSIVSSCFPIKVFKTQHFVPTDVKMVVTEADPSNRIVSEINAEPAAKEYARIAGLENTDDLSPLAFATNPLMVKVGGTYFVRSIARRFEDNKLGFFSAIDQGIVLRVAKSVDFIENLKQMFDEIVDEIGPPQLIIGCDCAFRKIELERKQMKQKVGELLVENNVLGFSTYGEQFRSMHVNQTFTGVAIGSRR